jgi:hypothetical protein
MIFLCPRLKTHCDDRSCPDILLSVWPNKATRMKNENIELTEIEFGCAKSLHHNALSTSDIRKIVT